jgi:queuine tRNA-ribosyltransferase
VNAQRFEVVRTKEGAFALRDAESGEIMHPGQGPLHEAQHLYIAPSRLAERLSEPERGPLFLLDVGLGAGTNALSALRVAERLPEAARRLEIVSFDLTSAALQHAYESEQSLAFGFTPDLAQAARALLAGQHYESERASWRLVLGDLRESLPREPARSADIVFWDPYSPRTNPELWSESAFSELHRVCREGATVHTYGAATATRSALLLAGFFVGLGPATGTKPKHATLAAMRLGDLVSPLDKKWLQGLPRVRDDQPCDPALSVEARARLALLPQFA